jgi:hypothetical protein
MPGTESRSGTRAGTRAGTTRRANIEDMLLVCGPLDLTYLRKWAEHLSISARLERVLRESGRSRGRCSRAPRGYSWHRAQ